MTQRWVTVRARHFLADELTVGGEASVFLPSVKLTDDTGASLFDPVTGGLKVTVVSGGGGGGNVPADVNVTDRPGRVLGRVGVDLLTDAVGLATDAGLASVFGRLADGTVRVGGTVAVSGPATDAQLRASPLPVSGPLTDAQLRAAAVPISAAALPLPAGAATQATLATLATDAGLASVYGRLADGSQHTIVDALPAGLATSAAQATGNASLASVDGKLPALSGGRVPVDGSGVTQPVSAAALPLPAGAATSAAQGTGNTSLASLDGKIVTAKTADLDTGAGVDTVQLHGIALPANGGAVVGGTATNPVRTDPTGTTTQPVSDGGGSLTVDSAQLPAALVGARLDTNNGAWLGSTAPTVGSKTSANSIPCVLASDQAAIPVTQSGTWTVQQGATPAALANAWPVKVSDGTNTLPTMDAAARKAFVAMTDGTNTAAVKAASTAAVATDPAAVVSLSPNSPVTPPTITKGAQGATGFTTQPLRDAGRTLVSIQVSGLATVTSEALISMTPYRDLVAGSAATTFAVTAGKKFRIQQIIVTVRCTSTVNVGGIVRLRLLAGTVLVGSPVHASVGCMGSNLATAVIGNAMTYSVDFPEALELSGTMQLGLTQLFSATTATIDVHVIGYEY